MRKRFLILILVGLPLFCLLAAAAYNLPPVHERLAWRVEGWRTRIQYAFNPPEQVVFTPQEQIDLDAVETIVVATLQALTPSLQPTSLPSLTPTQPGPTSTPVPSPTPTLTPTAIPGAVQLTGVVHEYQQMNNCGPATLSMGLSYWDWKGDQRDTRLVLRPNFKDVDDKNVMPAEMVAYVEGQTGLKAISRVGGDLDLLKRFVAAGFPVIVEKGLQQKPKDWLGHYILVTGYDDERQRFTTQDSLIMADLPVAYDAFAPNWWRDFNNVYIVIYPPEREADVLAILGPHADEQYNYQFAADRAREEVDLLSGRELYFAWFNLGTNLLALEDFTGAAQAYDQAFAQYAQIPEDDRPWRMLWYQTGPYEAYYATGRYQDVINLANTTLSFLGKPILEESLYWRGLALEGQGDLDGAINDYKKAAGINPYSTSALQQLQRLGVDYP